MMRSLTFALIICLCLFFNNAQFIPDYYYPINYVVNPYRFCHIAMQNPNFYGGDMILPDLANRFGRINESYLWPKGRIPYEIDWTLVNSRDKIIAGMKYIESETCIRFKERKNEENYVKIFKGIGCYSHVGHQDIGEQFISLGNGCYFPGIIIHELLHAIGLFHEHERPDRNEYLKIFWGNIARNFVKDFRRLPWRKVKVMSPFDYDSIMMYGSTAFSDDGNKITMLPKVANVILTDVWLKSSASHSDIYNINTLYNCLPKYD